MPSNHITPGNHANALIRTNAGTLAASHPISPGPGTSSDRLRNLSSSGGESRPRVNYGANPASLRPLATQGLKITLEHLFLEEKGQGLGVADWVKISFINRTSAQISEEFFRSPAGMDALRSYLTQGSLEQNLENAHKLVQTGLIRRSVKLADNLIQAGGPSLIAAVPIGVALAQKGHPAKAIQIAEGLIQAGGPSLIAAVPIGVALAKNLHLTEATQVAYGLLNQQTAEGERGFSIINNAMNVAIRSVA